MADKKFAGINGPVGGPELAADYESAKVFDKVKVGRLGVYYRDGFKIRFMDYSLLERVFIRIQEVNGRMCCGSTIFAYFRLVFVAGGREIGDAISENEQAMDQALALIKELAPASLAIGVEEKASARS